MKYLLALQVQQNSQANAIVVYNDARLLYSTLVDGMTGLPLLFDTETECKNVKNLLSSGYQLIPIQHYVMAIYPGKSAFATDQFYYSPQLC